MNAGIPAEGQVIVRESIPSGLNLEALPELAAFIDCAQHTITPKRWDSFWECEDSFTNLVRSSFVSRLVASQLKQMAEDCGYLPMAVTESEMPIHSSQTFGLTLRLISPNTLPPLRLYAATEHSMTGVMGQASVETDYFEQPEPFPNEVLDRTKKLAPRGRRVFKTGQIFKMKAGYDVGRLIPAPHDVCLLQFVTPPLLSLRWSYDDKSLLPVGAIAANPVSSRLQFAAKALMHFGDDSSILPLTQLAKYPDHFVRWQAIVALAEVHFESGVAALREALHDSHPHIRNAAKKSLDELDQTSERAKEY